MAYTSGACLAQNLHFPPDLDQGLCKRNSEPTFLWAFLVHTEEKLSSRSWYNGLGIRGKMKESNTLTTASQDARAHSASYSSEKVHRCLFPVLVGNDYQSRCSERKGFGGQKGETLPTEDGDEVVVGVGLTSENGFEAQIRQKRGTNVSQKALRAPRPNAVPGINKNTER